MSALLLVFAEPGPSLAGADFHEWYDEEHVPLRLPIPGILTAIRLKATDNLKPTWGAIYDIQDLSIFQTDEYKKLRSGRSEREQGVVDRLAPLDRRVYKLISERSSDAFKTQGWEKKDRTFIFVSFDATSPAAEEEFNKWYEEEHTGLLSLVPGWLRTRRYEMVEQGGTDESPPRLLAIHEYVDESGLRGEEFKKATSTQWREKALSGMEARKERRVFGTRKVWK